ncbi:MAG: hypothetical protein KDN22_01390, partial [Verrucomicrobiae bacterium]|nr:hypothetical protein [Verrucomicrobiae bacterium]
MPSLVDAILTPQVVEKQSPIVGAESATCELEVDFAAPGVACPDQGQLELERIAELACSAETQLGFPEDVEWAFCVDVLHLRPVTTIPARWTRDESAERFHSVITPMTWDLVDKGFFTFLNHLRPEWLQ